MKKNLVTAVLMTLATTILLGVLYPLLVTGLAQVLFRDKANRQLIVRNGQVVGSRILGQGFSGPGYFHSRPSAAGTGYDAANSSPSEFWTDKPEVGGSCERGRSSAPTTESGNRCSC